MLNRALRWRKGGEMPREGELEVGGEGAGGCVLRNRAGAPRPALGLACCSCFSRWSNPSGGAAELGYGHLGARIVTIYLGIWGQLKKF